MFSHVHTQLCGHKAGIPVHFNSTGRLPQNLFSEISSSVVLAGIMILASHPIRNKLDGFLVLNVMLLKA